MLADILTSRGFVLKKKTAKESSSPCPFCGGTDRFCIWPEDNRAWCRQCGWAGDDIQFVIDFDSVDFKEAVEKCGRTDKIIYNPPTKKKGKLTATYNYVDEQGKLLYQVLRFEPKTFSQRRPGDKNRWIYDLKNTRLVLYDLPNVLKCEAMCFVEGEKDVRNLQLAEVPATCNPMGAGKIKGQQEEHQILDPLQGKSVYIIPDNDSSGKEHAQEVAGLLQGIAREIKIIELDVDPKQDVSDWLGEHDTHPKEDLKRLISATPVWRPPSNFMDVNELLSLVADNHVPIIRGGILPFNEHLLIAGESGVGKSVLRLELAIHLAMGWDWLERFAIPTARTVAIFQYENSKENEQFRLQKMIKGLNIQSIPHGQIKFMDRAKRPNLSKVGDRSDLEEWVKESGQEIIVYDCLSNIHSNNENDNIKMREVLDVLTDIDVRCGTSSIVIHHYGKEGDAKNPRSKKARIRGASSLGDWATTMMSFDYRPNKENKALFELEVLKLREGPFHLWKNKPLILERDENFLCKVIEDYSPCTPDDVVNVLEELGRKASASQLKEAVAEFAECSERQAKRYIAEAVRQEKIFREGAANRVEYKISVMDI